MNKKREKKDSTPPSKFRSTSSVMYRARKKSHPVYVQGKCAVSHLITKSFTRTNKPKFEQAKEKLEF